MIYVIANIGIRWIICKVLARQNINCDFLQSVKSVKINRNAHDSNQSRVKCNVQQQQTTSSRTMWSPCVQCRCRGWAARWSLTTLITRLRCEPDTAARRRCGPTFARPVQQTNIFAENLFFHINNTMTLLQILVKRYINACRIQEWTANGRALAFLNIQSKRVDGY